MGENSRVDVTVVPYLTPKAQGIRNTAKMRYSGARAVGP